MDVETLIDGLPQKRITSKEYRRQRQMAACKILEDQKEFDFRQYLGEGSFGKVFSAYCPKYGKEVALKIVDRDDTSAGELETWPILDHENLLPLLDVIQLSNVDVFITSVLFNDLETLLEDEDFINSPRSLETCKKWLREILVGLDYLHTAKLCHLDIKADNILIDFEDRAVLCDFTYINSSDKPTDRYGVPLPYRPPEACLAVEKDIEVDAIKLEMWTYGILALNVLTRHFIRDTCNSKVKYWHKDVYPLIFETMKISYFRDLMASAFPGTNTSEEFTKGFNFVQFLLRLNPDDRPSAETSAKHPFLINGRNYFETPDDIWLVQDQSSWSCSCTRVNKPFTHVNFDAEGICTMEFETTKRKSDLTKYETDLMNVTVRYRGEETKVNEDVGVEIDKTDLVHHEKNNCMMSTVLHHTEEADFSEYQENLEVGVLDITQDAVEQRKGFCPWIKGKFSALCTSVFGGSSNI